GVGGLSFRPTRRGRWISLDEAMSAGRPQNNGEKAAPATGDGAFAALPADADLTNVVPLRRGRIAAARAGAKLALRPQDRPAPLWAAPARRHNLALFVGCSLL